MLFVLDLTAGILPDSFYLATLQKNVHVPACVGVNPNVPVGRASTTTSIFISNATMSYIMPSGVVGAVHFVHADPMSYRWRDICP
jgi:hypothetical protein